MKKTERNIFFALIILIMYSGFISAQIDIGIEEKEAAVPVSVKISGLDKPITIGKTVKAGITFEVEEGYKINLVPLFSVEAQPAETDLKISTDVLYDKDKLAEAKRKLAKGESVYLDHNKTHHFSVTITGKPGADSISVNWKVTLFYCSTDDGLCFKETLRKESILKIR